MRKLSLYSLVLLTGVGVAMVGCGSDDDSSPNGTAGSTGKAGSGNEAGSGDEAGAGGASASLYERLGGHEGIKTAITAIVGEELKDDDIATYFAPNLTNPDHSPQPGEIIECFTNLVGSATGGDEKYPFTTESGFTCRDMATAHAHLHIGSGTFDDFVTIAAATLKSAGVADADIVVLGAALNSTKPAIVDPDAPVRGPFLGEGGAGGEGGAAGAAGAP